jgi:hypothetical protein
MITIARFWQRRANCNVFISMACIRVSSYGTINKFPERGDGLWLHRTGRNIRYPWRLVFEDGSKGTPFVRWLVIDGGLISLFPYKLGVNIRVHANFTDRRARTPLNFIVAMSPLHDRTIRAHLVVSVAVATLT